jgi:hypothetical protein
VSSKTKSGTGFLDLPKELRDMIYQEICGKLKRKGVRWQATAPQTCGVLSKKDKEESEKRSMSGWVMSNEAWKSCPKDSADCTIMRTCRQVHAEFAAVLYGGPLELHDISQGSNVIPISPIYRGLVRTVFSTGAPGLNRTDDLDAWRTQLQIAAGLSGAFVDANTLRLGWFVARDHNTLCGNLWDSTVKEVVKAVKAVKKISYTPLIVPHNLEIVQMYWTNGRRELQSIPSPITDAIDMLRARKPTRSVRKTKQ